MVQGGDFTQRNGKGGEVRSSLKRMPFAEIKGADLDVSRSPSTAARSRTRV